MSPFFLNLRHFTFILHHLMLIIRNTFSHILICMLEKIQTCLTFVNPLKTGNLLHLFNNIPPSSWWIESFENWPKGQDWMLKICKEIMYSNFERKKNSQLSNTASMHHPSMLGLGIYTKVKRSKTLLFAPPFSSIKCLIKNYTKLK